MMALQVINPQLVIEHQPKESKKEELTIKSCKNHVCTYLTNMQEMRNEINSLRKNGIKYNKQQFLTLIFDNLGKTAGVFLANVKPQRSEW